MGTDLRSGDVVARESHRRPDGGGPGPEAGRCGRRHDRRPAGPGSKATGTLRNSRASKLVARNAGLARYFQGNRPRRLVAERPRPTPRGDPVMSTVSFGPPA